MRAINLCVLLLCFGFLWSSSIYTCSNSPVEPVVEYERVEVAANSSDVSCSRCVFYLEGNYVKMYKEIACFEDEYTQIKKPAMILFNDSGDFKIGFGEFIINGENSDIMPPFSYAIGNARAELDSIININNPLYATAINYWEDDKVSVYDKAKRFINIILSKDVLRKKELEVKHDR
jgi:hypothetical protein